MEEMETEKSSVILLTTKSKKYYNQYDSDLHVDRQQVGRLGSRQVGQGITHQPPSTKPH